MWIAFTMRPYGIVVEAPRLDRLTHLAEAEGQCSSDIGGKLHVRCRWTFSYHAPKHVALCCRS
jgi:hypothetical protein